MGPPSCNSIGVRLKDGKCWSKEDVATNVNWSTANSKCTGVWHLPTQNEYATLFKSYYPDNCYPTNGICGTSPSDSIEFFLDWGANPNNFDVGYWTATSFYNSVLSTTLYWQAGIYWNNSSHQVGVNGADRPTATKSVRCISN